MARQRHLSKAPIREAVVAFHFEPALHLRSVEAFAESIKGDFDQNQRVWHQSQQVRRERHRGFGSSQWSESTSRF